MRKIKMLLILLATMVTIGMASATGPSIDICTDSPAVCANPTTTLTVYQSVDASVNPGLHALFKNWDTSVSTYVVSVINLDTNTIVYGPSSGTVNTDPKSVYYAWTPATLGPGHYKVKAHAEQDPANGLEADVTVATRPNVVPELPTSILTAVGLIGLIGMVSLRKKN